VIITTIYVGGDMPSWGYAISKQAQYDYFLLDRREVSEEGNIGSVAYQHMLLGVSHASENNRNGIQISDRDPTTQVILQSTTSKVLVI
jgi:hypothetical protein